MTTVALVPVEFVFDVGEVEVAELSVAEVGGDLPKQLPPLLVTQSVDVVHLFHLEPGGGTLRGDPHHHRVQEDLGSSDTSFKFAFCADLHLDTVNTAYRANNLSTENWPLQNGLTSW